MLEFLYYIGAVRSPYAGLAVLIMTLGLIALGTLAVLALVWRGLAHQRRLDPRGRGLSAADAVLAGSDGLVVACLALFTASSLLDVRPYRPPTCGSEAFLRQRTSGLEPPRSTGPDRASSDGSYRARRRPNCSRAARAPAPSGARVR